MHRVADLEGALLDAAVAKALGHRWRWARVSDPDIIEIIDWNRPGTLVNGWRFQPSTDWAQGGPIIEREHIDLTYEGADGGSPWSAFCEGENTPCRMAGDTALQAAMRAFVSSKFGHEVEL